MSLLVALHARFYCTIRVYIRSNILKVVVPFSQEGTLLAIIIGNLHSSFHLWIAESSGARLSTPGYVECSVCVPTACLLRSSISVFRIRPFLCERNLMAASLARLLFFQFPGLLDHSQTLVLRPNSALHIALSGDHPREQQSNRIVASLPSFSPDISDKWNATICSRLSSNLSFPVFLC